MSRSPSVPLAGYDEMSSPDPLATSVNSEQRIGSSPSKRRAPGPLQRRSSKISSQISKASVEMDITPQSSPVKTVTEQTLSPWKIRVTVEAEPEDSNDAVQTYTRTMKIPLREESSSSKPQTATGRGSRRSSQSRTKPQAASPSRSRQGSATPTDGRRRRQSVTDLDIVVLGDDSDEAEWSNKPRKSSPRKNKTKRNAKKGDEAKSRRSSAQEFDIRQDANIQEDGSTDLALHSDSPELRQIDLNRVSVRSRTNSTKQKALPSTDTECPFPTTENFDLDVEPRNLGIRDVSTNSLRSYPTPSPTPSDGEHEQQNQEAAANGQRRNGGAEHEHHEGFDTIMESEGFTMIDLDTIPSARYLRSSPADVTYPVLSEDKEAATQQHMPEDVPKRDLSHPTPAKAFPSYLILAEGESEISSRIPSSPPLSQLSSEIIPSKQNSSRLQLPSSVLKLQQRKVTPAPYSSPRLPSPPRPLLTKQRSKPQSTEVLRVGMALQGALQPQETPAFQNPTAQSHATPKEQTMSHVRSSSDELFEGFDSGTQREMRAGLRFGEELAKRQQPTRVAQNTHDTDEFTPTENQVWRGQDVTHRTPVSIGTQPSSHLSGVSQNLESRQLPGHTQIKKVDQLATPPHIRSVGKDTGLDANGLNVSTQREELWQHERNIVVKEAREADPSKIITIDSDDGYRTEERVPDEDAESNVYEDEADIWLVEAKDSSSSPRAEPESSPSKPQQRKESEDVRNIAEKPRRSLIPSPWKRGDQVDIVGNESTMLTTGEGESAISGLFWKLPQDDGEDLRFGAKQLKNVRKELRTSDAPFRDRTASGSFNLDMMGTPKRIRESLEQEQTQNSSEHFTNSIHDESVDDGEEMDATMNTDGGSSLITPPQKVPVNFNDSTLSQVTVPPDRPTTPDLVLDRHPPTPRSAMKGRRQSVGTGFGNSSSETSDQAQRRVSFARRSNHVDEDGIESSRSMEAEDVTPINSEPVFEEQGVQQEIASDTNSEPLTSSHTSVENPDDVQKSWFSWLSKSKPDEVADASSKRPSANKPTVPQHDGSNDQPFGTTGHQSELQLQQEQGDWAPTSKSRSLFSSPATNQKPTSHQTSRSSSKPASQPQPDIPSYLLSPSFPSDPTLKIPLTASGEFTNSHFRTLHIIYRKSLRSRFHAPSTSSLRPEITQLVREKWTLDVDETKTELGSFAFSIREQEGRVLERFCREVEFGILVTGSDGTTGKKNSDREIEQRVHGFMDIDQNGIWSGRKPHGSGEVKWGWTCEQLATWLGRIVIGEVVRKEEFGGSSNKRTSK